MAVHKKSAAKLGRASALPAAKKTAAKPAAKLSRVKSTGGVNVVMIREGLGLSRKVFSRLSNYSERAIADWEAGKKLTAAPQQRMVELQRLQRALANVINEDYVGEWLQSPNEAFSGLKPLEVIERGETDRIWRMIYQLESGVPG